MASHARGQWRDARKRRFSDRDVAIAAGDAVVTHVVFVAEGNRLLRNRVQIVRIGVGECTPNENPSHDSHYQANNAYAEK
jgi:hypothetical protein